jgi:hypothetical protein
MKSANLTADQIRNAVENGKVFVVFNYLTGVVASLHKSHDSAIRKAAKLGHRHNVNNLRVGYEY